MRKKTVNYIFIEDEGKFEKIEENSGSKCGFVFFLITFLILIGAVGNYIIYTGQFLSGTMSKATSIALWVLVGLGIVASIIFMIWVRNRRIQFAEDFGFDPNSETIKQFNKKYSNALRKEKQIYEKKFGKKISFEEYDQIKWESWKKLKKLQKKNKFPLGYMFKDIDNDGVRELVKKTDDNKYEKYIYADPDNDGNFEFIKFEPEK
ncbi:MAG: hypothetical protein ACP6IY_20610 [Promethearchaeia archaeon]